MSEIRGFNKIVLGDEVDLSKPRGRETSVAQLIEIVEEIFNTLRNLDLVNFDSVSAALPTITAHLNNNNIHLTEEMHTALTTIVAAYESGALGGGGTTGGGTQVFASRVDLLDNTPSTHGAIATVEGEFHNLYVFDSGSGRWMPRDGNAYHSDELPSAAQFLVLTGTSFIDIDTGERIVWLNS